MFQVSPSTWIPFVSGGSFATRFLFVSPADLPVRFLFSPSLFSQVYVFASTFGGVSGVGVDGVGVGVSGVGVDGVGVGWVGVGSGSFGVFVSSGVGFGLVLSYI